uniref:Uncharacterized protein n=1 Tax=Bos mutus grunniens TaxID=30521 RepID=A0A8C0AME3_BOSMU
MFQIPEFEQSEQEDSSPADRGLGPSPTGQAPGLSKHWLTAPGLLGKLVTSRGSRPAAATMEALGLWRPGVVTAPTPQGQRIMKRRRRRISAFRGRSRSAPPTSGLHSDMAASSGG